jgi:hypothetical protein
MRSFLFGPVDGSRARTWLLVAATVAVGLLVVLGARGAVGSSPSRPATAAPTFTAGQLRLVESSRPGLRVLFIGNSFTAANSLPSMVARLAASQPASRQVFPLADDPGGSQLHEAVHDRLLQKLLRQVHWSVVVVQEQSQLPALPSLLHASTLPALRQLVATIRRDGARPLLFETWGYQEGDLMNVPDDSYSAMQDRLHDGYAYLSQKEDVPVAPIGDAWAIALRQKPATPLWSADGKHPSLEGSYLAAIVIAASVLKQDSPDRTAAKINTGYSGGLNTSTARWLQRIGLATDRERSPTPQRRSRG